MKPIFPALPLVMLGSDRGREATVGSILGRSPLGAGLRRQPIAAGLLPTLMRTLLPVSFDEPVEWSTTSGPTDDLGILLTALSLAAYDGRVTREALDAAGLRDYLYPADLDAAAEQDLHVGAFVTGIYLQTPNPGDDVLFSAAVRLRLVGEFPLVALDHPALTPATAQRILGVYAGLAGEWLHQALDTFAWNPVLMADPTIADAVTRRARECRHLDGIVAVHGPAAAFRARFTTFVRGVVPEVTWWVDAADTLDALAAQAATGDRTRVAQLTASDLRPLLGIDYEPLRLKALGLLGLIGESPAAGASPPRAR